MSYQSKQKVSKRKKEVIASCDLGKNEHWGFALAPDQDELTAFPFSNDLKGFTKFFEKVNKFKQEKGLERIVFGSESTGTYGHPLMHFMKEKGCRLVQVNPKHTSRFKEIEDNSPNKTDKKDPAVIARIISMGRELSVIIPQGIMAELRTLVISRENRMGDINRLKNRLEGILASFFPEYLKVMKGLNSKTSQCILEKHPTPKKITRLSVGNIARQMHRISMGRLGKQRAKELHEAAKNTVGVQEGVEARADEIKRNIAQIKFLKDQLSEIEEKISQCLKQVPYSENLLTIKGLGELTLAVIFSEITDIRAFSSAKKIEKLAGYNLFEVSSGNHRGKRRISKRGRSLLRKSLYYASLNMIKKGRPYYWVYQNHLEKGMIKKKAIVAIARKLVKVIFAMVRDNSTFIEPKQMSEQKNKAA